jgi:hypothetical protein
MARVLILTGDAGESLEVMYPYQRLLEEGYEVDIAAPSKKKHQFVVHDFVDGFDTYTETRLHVGRGSRVRRCRAVGLCGARHAGPSRARAHSKRRRLPAHRPAVLLRREARRRVLPRQLVLGALPPTQRSSQTSRPSAPPSRTAPASSTVRWSRRAPGRTTRTQRRSPTKSGSYATGSARPVSRERSAAEKRRWLVSASSGVAQPKRPFSAPARSARKAAHI